MQVVSKCAILASSADGPGSRKERDDLVLLGGERKKRMKKLLFAIAGAASFAALAADPVAGTGDIDVLGFENFDLTQTATVSGAVVNRTDTGIDGTSKWTSTGEDASLVKAYDEEVSAPNIKEPDLFDGGENTKYLALDTNGSELQRKIHADGSAQTIADPLYIDTLVQFTPSESAPTSTDLDGAKLAIWLGVDSENNTTNLYVQGLQYSDSEISVSAPVAYKITNVIPQPGTWYRLTVKAIPAALSKASMVSAFTVTIDGTEAIAEQCLLVGDAFATAEGDVALGDSGYILTETDLALISAKKVFGSMEDLTVTGLTSVGFKGTGALDDFVVTTVAPDLTPAAIDFTLTWGDLTAVSYQIGNGEPVSLTGKTAPFAVPGLSAGDVVKFVVQNADGAKKTLTGTAGTDTALDATNETFGWPEYLGEAVAGAYTIDDANDLDMLRKGVAAGLATVGETFNQTANIDMASAGAFAGIGTYAANLNSGVAFQGTYDGQGFKISNIDFTQRNYGGVFNQVKGGTIKNLTVDTITCSGFTSGEWGCAIVGNAGLGATLQGLTAMGSFGSASTPCTHNVAGIAVRVCGGASNVVNGVTMLETLVKDCTNNATLYGAYTKCAGITALTQDQNGVPDDYVLFDGCVNNANIAMVAGAGTEGRDGLAGILAYVSDGTKIQNCSNAGTFTSPLATAKIGAIVGCGYNRFLADEGGNKAVSSMPMVGNRSPASFYDSKGNLVMFDCIGFQYATVDNGVATTVTTLAKDTTYLLEGDVAASETPVFTLAEEGDTIAFDAALGYTFAGTIAAGEGLQASAETVGTVTTYTAAAGGDDYVVEIDGSDVVITPTSEDLAELAAAGVDTTSVAAVNAALAAPITGTTIPTWQATLLGIAPTEAGLNTFKIKSITIADGTVTVEMADGVSLKTGRGVDIKLKLMGSDDLSTWTQIGSDITNTKAIPAVTPALGETKKFYKVTVDFAGSQN